MNTFYLVLNQEPGVLKKPIAGSIVDWPGERQPNLGFSRWSIDIKNIVLVAAYSASASTSSLSFP